MKSVTIFGVGLMGGSFALALKDAIPGITIIGVDRTEVLERARHLKIIDEGDPQKSDLFVLAAPVDEILRLVADIVPTGKLITDFGSTKTEICRRAEQRGLAFIGGHPMTGSERAGPEAANARLFQEARYFLCPVSTTPADALAMMQDIVGRIGAIPQVMTADAHDRLVAQISHLPQLLSTLLADHVGANTQFSGPGLKSMLRLAGSPFHVWRDIFRTSAYLPDELEMFVKRLNAALESINRGHLEDIKAVFDRTDTSGAPR